MKVALWLMAVIAVVVIAICTGAYLYYRPTFEWVR